MTNDISSFKRKFHRTLEPLKVMLINRRIDMTEKQWESFVERTKESVIGHPDQYLGQVLPPPKTLRMIVQQIFEELVHREKNLRGNSII